jgi:hypothetical protein
LLVNGHCRTAVIGQNNNRITQCRNVHECGLYTGAATIVTPITIPVRRINAEQVAVILRLTATSLCCQRLEAISSDQNVLILERLLKIALSQ